MKKKLRELIEKLEKSASEHEHIHKHGSPMTSMPEDSAMGDVAAEQRRIIGKLREILG